MFVVVALLVHVQEGKILCGVWLFKVDKRGTFFLLTLLTNNLRLIRSDNRFVPTVKSATEICECICFVPRIPELL